MGLARDVLGGFAVIGEKKDKNGGFQLNGGEILFAKKPGVSTIFFLLRNRAAGGFRFLAVVNLCALVDPGRLVGRSVGRFASTVSKGVPDCLAPC